MKRQFLIAILFFSFAAYGPLRLGQTQNDPVRVGSKLYAESVILGQMILVALENAGYMVEDRTELGDTKANRDALVNGTIDIYPEYTGTAINNFFNDVPWANIPEDAAYNGYLTYTTISGLDVALNDLVWLQPAPANNTYALAITQEFSEANGIVTMTDFADYINGGGDILLVMSEAFAQRPDGLQSFEVTYGFELEAEHKFVVVGATPALTEQALDEGVNGISAAMVYSTDGALLGYDMIALTDDLSAQPIYQPTPVIRGEVLRAYPEIAGVLNPIFASLDTVTLQNLNKRVEVDGETPRDVATSFLLDNGFIASIAP